MILGVGKGTKLLTKYTKLDKKYIAKICIGEKSETGDKEGKIISKKTVKNIDTEKIEKALKEIIGINNLPVPVYSAIKKKGEALYKKARRGEKVKPPIKKMVVYEAKLLKTESKDDMFFVTAELKVGSGTYIRSIAEALGDKLGYPARLENLRRTQVGKFDVSNAEKINVNDL
jgi:tRNA pseudouridine55 synthase